MSLFPSSRVAASRVGFTEFEILKASHKFLRDENSEDLDRTKSWNEQLAEKYYGNLYREFAVCDLKHYKSGNFALRWRTEEEVISGAGETSCGNTRCDYHHAASSSYASPSRDSEQSRSKFPLTTLELPFAYEEHGEHKSALVKVVLCDRCVRKLMYKRNKEKKGAMKAGERASHNNDDGSKGEGEVRKDNIYDEGRLTGLGNDGAERKGKAGSLKILDHAKDEERRRKRHRDEDHEVDERRRHKHRKRSRSPANSTSA